MLPVGKAASEGLIHAVWEMPPCIHLHCGWSLRATRVLSSQPGKAADSVFEADV